MKRKQKINESEVMKFGFLGGIAQAVYILFLVLFMSVLERGIIVSSSNQKIFFPVIFLMTFVFSAGVSALLVFGYPAYLATQKRYVEGLMTAITTLLTLVIIGILVFMMISFL